MYDYGVFLRLRYQTSVQDRVRVAYEITKRIFTDFQRAPSVDWAIPFVYSYRSALEKREEELPKTRPPVPISELPVEQIDSPPGKTVDREAVEEVAQSIARHGLLQPIVVARRSESGRHEIVAGQLRLEACKRLGWKTVPVIVQSETAGGLDSRKRPSPGSTGHVMTP